MRRGPIRALRWSAWLGALGLWQWVSARGLVSALLLPSPAQVLDSAWNEVLSEPDAFALTLLRAGAGLALGLAFGAGLAMAASLAPALEPLTRVFGMVLRCVPIMALTPTITLIVGFGGTAAVVTTLVMSFFPAFALVSGALQNIPADHVRLTTVAGGRRWRFLWHVGAPMALPEFVLAVRLTGCLAVLACTTAEFLTANDGLGALLARAQVLLATETVWAVLLVSTVCAVLCWEAGDALDRWVRARLCMDRQ